jgi:Zn-dependent protease with chaperone function
MVSGEDAVRAAKDAYKQGRYSEAIQLLESLSPESLSDPQAYFQAQVGLVKAYQAAGFLTQAAQLTQKLAQSDDLHLQEWAKKKLEHLAYLGAEIPSIDPAIPAQPEPIDSTTPETWDELAREATSRSQRSSQQPVKVSLSSTVGRLDLAIWITVGVFLLLLVWLLLPENAFAFRLSFNLRNLTNSIRNFTGYFAIALSLVINLSAASYLLSDRLQDLMQRWLYGTQWISLKDLASYSAESSKLLEQVCTRYNLKIPRLGVIADPHPVAFAYGTAPDQSRLVFSQGLLSLLSEDEIAAVCAYGLGRIQLRTASVLSLISAPLQVFFLAYAYTALMGEGRGKSGRKDLIGHLSPLLYVIYNAGAYPLFWLSRLGTYHADHFAVEQTGNPNGLARALTKTAHGIVQAGKRRARPSFLLDGTRLFGLLDLKTVTAASTAEQVHNQPQQCRRIFLWDLANPWARWMQVNSSHPLLGQRIRILGLYADRLRLPIAFGMDQVNAEIRQLDQERLRLQQRFWWDLSCYGAEVVGLVVAWVVGLLVLFVLPGVQGHDIAGMAIVGFGAGMISKAFLLYPRTRDPELTNVVTAMADPYASPVSSQALRLQGELFGRGRVGYQLGAELKIQDRSGTLPVRYTSRLGPLGNLVTGMSSLQPLVGSQVEVTGWLRRGISPWLDLLHLKGNGRTVRSHPRIWLILFGSTVIILGVLVMVYYPQISPLFSLRYWIRRYDWLAPVLRPFL